MPVNPAFCPADLDEVAEQYVMESLPQADVTAFKEHLLVCARCRTAVADADLYVAAMRAAAAEFRSGSPKPERNAGR